MSFHNLLIIKNTLWHYPCPSRSKPKCRAALLGDPHSPTASLTHFFVKLDLAASASFFSVASSLHEAIAAVAMHADTSIPRTMDFIRASFEAEGTLHTILGGRVFDRDGRGPSARGQKHGTL